MRYNVAFFGTSHYSTPIVDTLLNNDIFNLVAVITKPSLPHYQRLANQTETIVLTPTTLKGQEGDQLFDTLESLNIDIGVVADYGNMIPTRFIELPKHSILNIHFSKLPLYRGASPVQYTILHGLNTATYTFLEMRPQSTPAMDSGDIVWQKDVPLVGLETTDMLYNRLFLLAANDLKQVLVNYINGTLTPTRQDHGLATFTTPTGMFDRTTLIQTDDAFITADQPDHLIERAIRAFTPWPTAWTTLDTVLKIAKRFDPSITKLRENKNPSLRVLLLNAHLENNRLILDTVQAEGKKPAPWNEFKNGYFE